MKRSTIVVLGAGPAGLAAAIVLARNGRDVEVYDRGPCSGHRFNGDYQGIENWTTDTDALAELMNAGIDVRRLCQPVAKGLIFNSARSPLTVTSPTPLFYMVKRGPEDGSLDSYLQAQAAAMGVRLCYGARHPQESPSVDVIATGPRRARAVAAGISFDTDLPDSAYAMVGNDLAPQGYTYLLASSNRATIATVLFSDHSQCRNYLSRAIAEYRRLTGINIKNPRRWTGYADFSSPRPVLPNGRLVIGEAAGFQDHLFGFGIRAALVSAVLAAQSILQGSDYVELCRDRLFPLIKVSRINRALYTHLGTFAYNLLWRSIGASPSPGRVLRLLYTHGRSLSMPTMNSQPL